MEKGSPDNKKPDRPESINISCPPYSNKIKNTYYTLLNKFYICNTSIFYIISIIIEKFAMFLLVLSAQVTGKQFPLIFIAKHYSTSFPFNYSFLLFHIISTGIGSTPFVCILARFFSAPIVVLPILNSKTIVLFFTPEHS